MFVTEEIPWTHDGDMMAVESAVLSALGHCESFKLKAEAPTDTLHGSVTIQHFPDKLIVAVQVYEEDSGPIPGATVFERPIRASTLARPDPMPSEAEIIARLNTLA